MYVFVFKRRQAQDTRNCFLKCPYCTKSRSVCLVLTCAMMTTSKKCCLMDFAEAFGKRCRAPVPRCAKKRLFFPCDGRILEVLVA